MPYVPLTEAQFNKAQASGFSTQQIIGNEKVRKAAYDPFNPNNPQAKQNQANVMQGSSTRVFGSSENGTNNLDKTIVEGAKNYGKSVFGSLNDAVSSGIQETKEDPGFRGGVETFGQAAKGAISPITNAIAPIIQGDAQGLENNSLFKKVANSPVGGIVEKGENAVSGFGDWFSQKFPKTGRFIGALGNIANLGVSIPASEDVSAMAKSGGGDLAGKVRDVAGDISNKVQTKVGDVVSEKVAKMQDTQAGQIDEKLGLNKNTKAAVKARKMGAVTGAKTPGQVLVENGIKLDENAVPALDEHIAVRDAANQAILKTEGKYVSLDEAAAEAKSKLTSGGTDLEKQKAIIDKEVEAYKKQVAGKGDRPSVTDQNGQTQVPAETADKVKGKLYKSTYGKNLTSEDSLATEAKKNLAESINKKIQSQSENPHVKALNRERGDLINTRDALNGKDLSQLGKKGVVARATEKIIGGVLGSHLGPAGAIAGYELAGTVGDLLDKMPEAIRQSMIDNLKETPEGQSVLQKVQDLTKQRQAEQSNAPLLGEGPIVPPAPADKSGPYYQPMNDVNYQNNIKKLPSGNGQGETIFSGPGPAAKPQVTDPERFVFRNPKTGQMERGYKSTSK